jgi:hypothetical protein
MKYLILLARLALPRVLLDDNPTERPAPGGARDPLTPGGRVSSRRPYLGETWAAIDLPPIR